MFRELPPEVLDGSRLHLLVGATHSDDSAENSRGASSDVIAWRDHLRRPYLSAEYAAALNRVSLIATRPMLRSRARIM
jgi:hypothetical protein